MLLRRAIGGGDTYSQSWLKNCSYLNVTLRIVEKEEHILYVGVEK